MPTPSAPGERAIFCSTIIPTIGRATLARAVQSVLDQELAAEIEVIVVNDSGQPLPAAEWAADPRVRIIATNRRRVSVARNTGAAIARGAYLHFLDDDDWLFPGALQELWRLAQAAPSAVALYGSGVFVDANGQALGVINLRRTGNCLLQLMAGSWIQVGQQLTHAGAFFQAGGFDPQLKLAEEAYLGRRLALLGDFVHTDASIVHILRGEGWQTTADHLLSVRFNRLVRSRCLSEPGAWGRMRAGADTAYWHGRLAHAYLTDLAWCLRRGRLAQAASRALYGLASIVAGGPHLFTAPYWQAMVDHHVPCSEVRVLTGLRRPAGSRRASDAQ